MRIKNKDRNLSIEKLIDDKQIEEQPNELEQTTIYQDQGSLIKLMAVNESSDDELGGKKHTASTHPNVRVREAAKNPECEENFYSKGCLNHERCKNILDSKTMTETSFLTKKYGKHGPA
jgi:hypothetical protein